jgi:hypothetical protein
MNSIHFASASIILMSILSMAFENRVHAQQSDGTQKPGQVFWIGGYGPGIYASRLGADGSMAPPRLVATQARPSFFALHPKLDVLYVVSETAINDKERAASLAAYQFDRAAYQAGGLPDLKLLNIEKVRGNGPSRTLSRRGKLWKRIGFLIPDRRERFSGSRKFDDPAPGFRPEHRSPERASCSLLDGRSDQSVGPGGRPWTRSGPGLQARCSEQATLAKPSSIPEA